MANLRPGDGRIGFELPGVDDRRHVLTDYADKEAVVVVFTCNHCPYARAWEDRIIQIQADYGDRGVQVMAINPNDPQKYPEDSFPKMNERAQEKGFNFPRTSTMSRKRWPAPSARSARPRCSTSGRTVGCSTTAPSTTTTKILEP